MKLSKKVLLSGVVCSCLGTFSGFSCALPDDVSISFEECPTSNHEQARQIALQRQESVLQLWCQKTFGLDSSRCTINQ